MIKMCISLLHYVVINKHALFLVWSSTQISVVFSSFIMVVEETKYSFQCT